MSHGSSSGRWPLLATILVAAVCLCRMPLHAHSLSVPDPLAPFRVFKLHGRSYVGPGLCDLTLDCGKGYVDGLTSALAVPGTPDTPVLFTNDTSRICTDIVPPNLAANYSCSLASDTANCAGTGKTCRCKDLCSTGPLCNLRRTSYKFEASHVVFNGVNNVSVSLGTISGTCAKLTETYRATTPDYDNHVLLARKSGYELSYAAACGSQFGPMGCAQFNTRWREYRCFSPAGSVQWKGQSLASPAVLRGSNIHLPYLIELHQGSYINAQDTIMPIMNRTLPTSEICCPRGTTGLLCSQWVGCRLHGCDNGATCDTVSGKCKDCPLNFTSPDPFCRSNLCQNGGILSSITESITNNVLYNKVTSPVCICPPEWTGYGCELKNQCLNGGTIYSTPTRLTSPDDPPPTNGCICAGKFYGDKCQNVCPLRMGVKPCFPITTKCPAACSQNVGCVNGGCSNGGTCNEATGICMNCPNGWHGQYCDISCSTQYDPVQCARYDLDEYIDGNIKYHAGIPRITLSADVTSVATQFDIRPPISASTGKPALNCNRLDFNATMNTTTGLCTCSNPCLFGPVCNVVWQGTVYLPTFGSTNVNSPTYQMAAPLRNLASSSFPGNYIIDCRVNQTVTAYSAIRQYNGLPAMFVPPHMTDPTKAGYNPCYSFGSAGCGVGFTCQRAGRRLDVTFKSVYSGVSSTVRTEIDGVCCRHGYSGARCDVYNGCKGTPCLNGGKCLTTLFGKELPSNETVCFGCNAGVNGTAGWTGTFCEIPLAPTYTTVKVSALPSASRRLLQSSEDAYISVRASFVRSSDKGGKIYREPARACDCNVQWQTGVVEDLTSSNPGKPIVKFGNYAPWSHSADAVMLSPMRFEANSPIQPVWRRKVSSHAEAQYQASVDFGFGGYYAEDPDVNGNFYVSFWYDNTRPRVLEGLVRTAPYSAHYVYTNILGRTGTVRLTRYDLNRAPDKSKCASMAFDPVFYYNKYPSQCESVRALGGIGNLRLPNNTVIATETLAYLHFHFFGHRVRNQPNANCDLTGDWAEDETGCVNKLRYPKAYYPLAVNETLTSAICGNVSRIEPSRVAFDKALQPGATGTNITDDGQAMCKCFPPFRAADEAAQVDCSFDLCGMVDKRGLVNASHAGYFTETASPEACVCQGIWGTDPDTCIGNKCAWCAATVCHNGGTASGSDYEAGCQCAPIFNGTLCENILCNPQHSYPHNASLWQDRILEQIVCDCRPGWTGTLCNEQQCANGEFNFQTSKCECFEGWNAGVQGICDDSKCIPSHGLWNQTKQGCDCEHPWRGDKCEIDMCDDYNSVLEIPGWDGMRPFGQSVISQVDGLWTCKCNWPYMALNRTNDGEFDDRSWDCKANDCGHGIPTPHRNWLNRTITQKALVNGIQVDKLVPVAPVPAEACTCRDPYGIGILTDPTRCIGMSHAECPNSCLLATCQLPPEKIELIGGYVPVASGDPSCCMCPASAMFQSTGTCQHFCRFYQPCLTTERSSFAFNPNYTSDPFAYDNVTREYDPDSQQYVCKCNAYYSNTSPDMNDCANYTFIATDPHWNLTGNTYLTDPDKEKPPPLTPISKSSSGGSGLSSTEQALAIGLSVGAVVVVGIVQALQAWFKSTTAVAEAGKKIVSSVVEGTLDGVKSSLGPKTGSSSGNSVQMTSFGVMSMLYIVVLLSFVRCEAAGGVRAWPDTLMWNEPSTTRCHSERPREILIGAPVSFTSSPVPKSDWIRPRAGFFAYTLEVESNGLAVGVPPGDNRLLVSEHHVFLPINAQIPFIMVGSNTRIPTELVTMGHVTVRYGTSNAEHQYGSINICNQKSRECSGALCNNNEVYDPDRTCKHGTCTSIAAFAKVDAGKSFTFDGVNFPPGGYVKDSSGTIRSTSNPLPSCANEYSDPNLPQFYAWSKADLQTHHTHFLARGCVCSDGYYGLYCEKTCPLPGLQIAGELDTHILCSGHGECASNTVETTNGVYTCACQGGCRCRRGYTGKFCEKAVQSKELYIFGDRTNLELTDIGTCCPDGVTDCSVRTNAFTSNVDLISVIPRMPCPGPLGSSCGASNALVFNYDGPVIEFSEDAKISQHLSVETVAQMGGDQCGQFAQLHGYEGVGNNGRGQCWAGVDSAVTSASKTFCWCNPDQKEYQKKYRMGANDVAIVETTTQLSMIPRRGFYGERCLLRTCTSRIDPQVQVPDRLGNSYLLVVKAPLVNGYAKQCSGHSSGQWNGNSTNYDDNLQPCEDKANRVWDAANNKWTFTNINTDGRCKGCDHGWGLVPGYHVMALKGTNYPEYQSPESRASYGSAPNGDQGVCAEKTYHTIGGNACGGYYSALIDARNNTLPGPTGSKQVQYVGGCDCGPEKWGLIVPPNNGGICQRTCAGNTTSAAIPLEFFDDTGAFMGNDDFNMIVAPDPPKCGGYKQGICRPINNHGYDGWNSACLCNAGYNGPDCAKDESMWKNGTLCGNDAEPYPVERPAGAKKYSDYMDVDFFHRSIVPLQGEGLLSKTAYSMHKCRCKDYAVAAGWEMDGNFCGPSCNSLRSSKFGNLVCSGATQGTCISSPYPDGVGKVCRCAKGWAGEKCDIRILHDKLGRECGGPGRGKIVFKDAFNMTQRCDCVAPFVPNPIAGEMNGTCWADCPVNPLTKLKCSGEDQGACTLDLVADGLNGMGTKNDNVCICTAGAFEGKDCSTRLVAVYTTQNGRVMPCTGHGLPDSERNGFCRCDPGWIGFACEIYSPNRQCGTGQTFLDHEALGYNVL